MQNVCTQSPGANVVIFAAALPIHEPSRMHPLAIVVLTIISLTYLLFPQHAARRRHRWRANEDQERSPTFLAFIRVIGLVGLLICCYEAYARLDPKGAGELAHRIGAAVNSVRNMFR